MRRLLTPPPPLLPPSLPPTPSSKLLLVPLPSLLPTRNSPSGEDSDGDGEGGDADDAENSVEFRACRLPRVAEAVPLPPLLPPPVVEAAYWSKSSCDVAPDDGQRAATATGAQNRSKNPASGGNDSRCPCSHELTVASTLFTAVCETAKFNLCQSTELVLRALQSAQKSELAAPQDGQTKSASQFDRLTPLPGTRYSVIVSSKANGPELATYKLDLQHQQPTQQQSYKQSSTHACNNKTHQQQQQRATRETQKNSSFRVCKTKQAPPPPPTLRSGQRSSATLAERKAPQTSTRASTVSRACSRTALLEESDDIPRDEPPFASVSQHSGIRRGRAGGGGGRPENTSGGRKIVAVLFRPTDKKTDGIKPYCNRTRQTNKKIVGFFVVEAV